MSGPSDRLSKTGVVGLVLAAGKGERFDPAGIQNKLLAHLPDGRQVIEATLDLAQAVLDELAVVVAPGASGVREVAAARGVRLVDNPEARSGMGSSVAAGVRAFPDARAWLILLADMPFVLPSTVAAIAGRVALVGRADRTIVLPTCGGRRGNPVALSAGLFGELVALAGDRGARDLFDRHPVERIELADSGILRDVDTPADLQPPR